MKKIKAAIQRWLNRLWGATRIPKAINHATQRAAARGWFFFAAIIKASPVLLLNAVGLWGVVRVAMHAHSNLELFAKVLSGVYLCSLIIWGVMEAYGEIRSASAKAPSNPVSEE